MPCAAGAVVCGCACLMACNTTLLCPVTSAEVAATAAPTAAAGTRCLYLACVATLSPLNAKHIVACSRQGSKHDHQ
jgi:hypothetical protein